VGNIRQRKKPRALSSATTFAGHLVKTFKPNELPQNDAFETEINKALKEHLQITQKRCPCAQLIKYHAMKTYEEVDV
jgi:hypothetical protein